MDKGRGVPRAFWNVGSICSKPTDPQADRICNKANDHAWPALARSGQIASKRGDSVRIRGLMVIEAGDCHQTPRDSPLLGTLLLYRIGEKVV